MLMELRYHFLLLIREQRGRDGAPKTRVCHMESECPKCFRGYGFVGVCDLIRGQDIQIQRLNIGQRNHTAGLINLYEHETRISYPLVHLSLKGGLQIEESITEGGCPDVWGFVHQAQSNAGLVGVVQCLRNHQDGQGC